MIEDWPADDPLTDDALTARVRMWQRKRGHRYSLDDLLTARVALDEVADNPPARYLDLGCGLGSVLLSVSDTLLRADDTQIAHGIEAQDISFRLAEVNVARDPALAAKIRLHHGDLREPPAALVAAGPFELITGTPPYQPPGTATPSPDSQRAHARIEYRGGVEVYLARARALASSAAHVVVCVGGATPGPRTFQAGLAEGFAALRRIRAIPRAGSAPLFEVWVFAPGVGPQELGAVPTEDFVARDGEGQRTLAYRELRASFGLGDLAGGR